MRRMRNSLYWIECVGKPDFSRRTYFKKEALELHIQCAILVVENLTLYQQAIKHK